MKRIKYLLFLPVVMTAALYYYSCDDAGITTVLPAGRVFVTVTNLKTLDKNVEGVYQLWILFLDSAGNPYTINAGSFNVDQNGKPVDIDSAGVPAVFELGPDTANVSRAVRCYISVGPNDGDPNHPRLLADTFHVSLAYSDSIIANPNLGNTDAVGIGEISGLARFILQQPTSNNLNCERGIWFTNINGTDFLPLGGISSQWTYEGWVVDVVTAGGPYYYSTGKFLNPNAVDFDGAGLCAGTSGFYSKPGQDWVTTFSGCLPVNVASLRNGNFQALVTLEPTGENAPALAKPFFLWLLKEATINATCGNLDNLVNYQNYGLQPSAHVQIGK